MKNNEYSFNKQFFIKQIEEAKKAIRDNNLLPSEKKKLADLIVRFQHYVQSKNFGTMKKEAQVVKNKEEIYSKLENKFSNDLKRIPLENWVKLKEVYNDIAITDFQGEYHETFSISDEKMIELILSLYKNLDDQYYQAASTIINHPIPLINFEQDKKIESHCYLCQYLKLPFISVYSNDNNKFPRFIHELQHGVDWIINNYNSKKFCTELAPIFFETIVIDVLSSIESCENLYNVRINAQNSMLKWLLCYSDILIKFEQSGRKIDKDNIIKILNIQNRDDFYHKSNRLININFVGYYDYVISFLKALEIRNKYYTVGKKQAINDLKICVSANKISINFEKLVEIYNSYIEEIKEKQSIKKL